MPTSRAATTAPGWLDSVAAAGDAELGARVESLRTYLRDTPPPRDYGRVLLLQAATRFPGILDDPGKGAIMAMLRGKQKPDGGWSLRTFAAPEARRTDANVRREGTGDTEATWDGADSPARE